MPNRLAAGLTRFIALNKAARGLSLTYTRGSDSVTLTGWPGNTSPNLFARIQAEPSSGSETSNACFMMAVADLEINGSAITPRIGDEIEATIEGTAMSFVVMPPNQGEQAWRYSDEQTRQVLRVYATPTPWQTATVYRPSVSAGAGGLRSASLVAVYASTLVKFVPQGGDFEVNGRVSTFSNYKAYFATNAVDLYAGDVIEVSSVKYQITGQVTNGRTSLLPECDCVRYE